MDYESYTRVHLLPAFGDLQLKVITIELIEEFIAAKRHEGKAVKEHPQLSGPAARDVRLRGQARLVPPQPRSARRKAARPTQPGHPLSRSEELEALLAATPTDERGTTERVLYLTAAMTGASPRRTARAALAGHRLERRRGARPPQLHARPVGTPKSRRSSRAVPLAQRVRPNSSSTASDRGSSPQATSSSATPNSVSCSTRRSSANASRTQPDEPGSDRSVFTIFATPSAPAWRPPAHPPMDPGMAWT